MWPIEQITNWWKNLPNGPVCYKCKFCVNPDYSDHVMNCNYEVTKNNKINHLTGERLVTIFQSCKDKNGAGQCKDYEFPGHIKYILRSIRDAII